MKNWQQKIGGLAISLLLALVPLAPVNANDAPIFTEYAGGSQPRQITTAPDGAVWFVNNYTYVNRIDSSGTVTSYAIPSPTSSHSTAVLSDVAVAANGMVWVTLAVQNYIVKVDPSSGQMTAYQVGPGVGNASKSPQSITAGPDGAMWFVASNANTIGKITPDGVITEYPIPTADSLPIDITAGSDGALWFTENSGGKIGKITTAGSITEYNIPTPDISPIGITVGPDNALWFTATAQWYAESAKVQVSRITTSGAFTEHNLPVAFGSVESITAGPDGALWLTRAYTDKLTRITTAGEVQEYPLPYTNAQPTSVTTSGNAVWFTQYGRHTIGRATVTTTPAVPTTPSGLTVPSPTNQPVLAWGQVVGATGYNVYRDGQLVAGTTNPTYTDNNAAEGTRSYYVTAVNTIGESAPSTSVATLVDLTAPLLGEPEWSVNPMQVGDTSTLTVPATDTGSGVTAGEYFIGEDPGVGNGAAAQFNNGMLSVLFGADMGVGVYNIGVRAKDAVGEWSTATTTMLVVTDSTTDLKIKGKNKKDLVPSIARGDHMPGLIAATQTDAADYGMTVKYENGTLDARSDFHFSYETGTKCNKPAASNCHTFNLDATTFQWMFVSGTNNTHGWFQGTAAVTVDGITTSNPFTVQVIDDDNLESGSGDYLILKVFTPGADLATATPLYQASGFMAKGKSVVIK